MVVHDLIVASKATVMEVDETTTNDPMVRDHILDQLAVNITSDLLSEDARVFTNPTSLEPVKLVEKKRKVSALDYAPARFKVKIKKRDPDTRRAARLFFVIAGSKGYGGDVSSNKALCRDEVSGYTDCPC